MLLKEDRTTTEENIGTHLITFLKELLGMLELKLIIVVIGLRSEAYFLHFYLNLLLLHLLCAFLLLVKELGIVDDTADRWLCIRRYFHEVNPLLTGNIQSLTCRHH